MFKRTIEDFTCERCGIRVKGTGYTNHCPHCLWSKHVDVNPGDRAEKCLGAMEPVALEGSTPDYKIVHRCTRCGQVRRIGVGSGDNKEALLALAERR